MFLLLRLYRTRCATEDEEHIIAEEIENMFPNSVEDDFGEFIQNATLEQIIKKKQRNGAADPKNSNILNDEDFRLICEMFTDIMFKYAR